MPIVNVGELVSQIAKELRGRKVTRTVFVKLMYLCEYEYFKRNRQRLTSLRWISFHYGPWAYELKDLGGGVSLLEAERTPLDSGRVAYLLGGGDQYKLETTTFIRDVEITGIVRSIVDEWSEVHLNRLLDYVYNHTEPMLNIDSKGEILNFDTIAKPLVIPPYKPPKEEVERLRQRVKEAVQRRREFIGQAQKTKILIKDPTVIRTFERLREPEHEKPIYASKVKGTSKYPSPYPQEE